MKLQDRVRRGLEKLITREIQRRGFQVDAGNRADPPEGKTHLATDADHWRWDLRTYLYRNTIDVYDLAIPESVATCRSIQDSFEAMSQTYPEIIQRTKRSRFENSTN